MIKPYHSEHTSLDMMLRRDTSKQGKPGKESLLRKRTSRQTAERKQVTRQNAMLSNRKASENDINLVHQAKEGLLTASEVKHLISSLTSGLAVIISTEQQLSYSQLIAKTAKHTDDFRRTTKHFKRACISSGHSADDKATRQAVMGSKLMPYLVQLLSNVIQGFPDANPSMSSLSITAAAGLYDTLASILWWLCGAFDKSELPKGGCHPAFDIFKDSVDRGLFEVLRRALSFFPAHGRFVKGYEASTFLCCLTLLATVPPVKGLPSLLPSLSKSKYIEATALELYRCAQQPDYLQPFAPQEMQMRLLHSFMAAVGYVCDEYYDTQGSHELNNPMLTMYVTTLMNDTYVVEVLRLVLLSILSLDTDAWPSAMPAGGVTPFNLACTISNSSSGATAALAAATSSRNEYMASSSNIQASVPGSQGINDTQSHDSHGGNKDALPSASSQGEGHTQCECLERLAPRAVLASALNALEVLVDVNHQYKGCLATFKLILQLRQVVGFAAEWQPAQVVVRRLHFLKHSEQEEAAGALAELLVSQLQRVPGVVQRMLSEGSLSHGAVPATMAAGQPPGRCSTAGSTSNTAGSSGIATGSSDVATNSTSSTTSSGDTAAAGSSSPGTSGSDAAAAQLPSDVLDLLLLGQSFSYEQWPWLDKRTACVLLVSFQALQILTALLAPELMAIEGLDDSQRQNLRHAVAKSQGPQLLPLAEVLMRLLPLHYMHETVATMAAGAMMVACGNPNERAWFGENAEMDKESLLVTMRKFIGHWMEVVKSTTAHKHDMLDVLCYATQGMDQCLAWVFGPGALLVSVRPSDSLALAGYRLQQMIMPPFRLRERPITIKRPIGSPMVIDYIHSWPQSRLAQARPAVGCWHVGCLNLNGPSESALKLLKCSRCQVARYCCAACQRADWKHGHKQACAQMAATG